MSNETDQHRYKTIAISENDHKRITRFCRKNGLKIGSTVGRWIREKIKEER